MIERYTLPEMGSLWTDNYKLKTWLQVEIAACEAQAELGYIPESAVEEIKAKANFDLARVLEIEAQVRHDVIAFLTNVNEYVGDAGRYIHLGLTSSDVLDTALALQLVASTDLLLEQVETLAQAIRYQAQQHRNTVMIGRSHGIHAEPITFGFKLAGWLAEVCRNRERLIRLRQQIAVGKISGAVGTYANVDPRVEAIACQKLGLQPDTASTQVISRDIHAEYVQTLALLAASIERFAVEIRNLQRTDVLEVEEFFARGQKGSSAMPHKRNPIRSERLTGLARIVRGHAIAALENVALWHERDISHSSVERMILPDASIITHFMLVEITDLVKNLLVYPDNMKRNMNLYGGVVFSQRVLLTLVEKGMSREEAYRIVQSCAHQAWNTPDGDFHKLISQDSAIQSYLSPEEIESCFRAEHHLKHLDEIYQRLSI
ncbi:MULTISPECIES: adenylosuccinate lyase [Arthrospira]|jgi:adenylosuccinate lyase|uniref:Adenylosuccinate lyase n=1 Tax=Limnospira platensis NIES-46 TaxID=1236695 RepID=A0A5M3T701_LIMPL|nr:adenylosuccinate lyase [Arthrospira platensis]AMW27965.1 adenylosuccinate lyase [Arthrospira platensis YZ]KDR54495.1 adenylosuccinate lyase [Arthrospira platensis str. Paraca]MBD2670837.1 adenylosuccinate lyase [Arthrospira platensis FACHB-439]MBD2711587.1 adenylosuccinate lyase [Arthrospira platensis FACHB-835]MDF2210919.1 adenylosuccinate lyase [Arthrospira platensis NCB002]MDT9184205.1 adenylosuccinate lyase [Limnospira sp. PMC 289.06]MDT9296380.1 adenylosuccinate lyase [Arthrospira pl